MIDASSSRSRTTECTTLAANNRTTTLQISSKCSRERAKANTFLPSALKPMSHVSFRCSKASIANPPSRATAACGINHTTVSLFPNMSYKSVYVNALSALRSSSADTSRLVTEESDEGVRRYSIWDTAFARRDRFRRRKSVLNDACRYAPINFDLRGACVYQAFNVDLDGAIEYYHQALSCKPDNPFSTEMLNRALREALSRLSV
jgi:hypothetical protein